MGGIDAAKAAYILMADADDSYNFLETPKFYQKIREGFDLVQGCRLPNGGGKIEKVLCHGLIATLEILFSHFWSAVGSVLPSMMSIAE